MSKPICTDRCRMMLFIFLLFLAAISHFHKHINGEINEEMYCPAIHAASR